MVLNIIIPALIVLFVILAVRKTIKDRKNGISSCGCDCGSCGLCGAGQKKH